MQKWTKIGSKFCQKRLKFAQIFGLGHDQAIRSGNISPNLFTLLEGLIMADNEVGICGHTSTQSAV